MTPEDLFWAAHTDLPREAPGSDDTARLLLRLAGPLPGEPRVLDIGCGTGPATLLLARETGGRVTAVDLHEPYLARLRAAADAAGLGGRVHALAASMDALPAPDGPLPAGAFDLVWAEGSAYVMGFDAALRAWRSLLAPGGVLVLTEAEWTTPDPAPGAREFWAAGYPAMRTTAGNVAAAQAAGWTVAATFLLPDTDWAAYYDPLAARIAALRAEHPGCREALDEVGAEIGVRAAHGGDFGYTGYVLRPRV